MMTFSTTINYNDTQHNGIQLQNVVMLIVVNKPFILRIVVLAFLKKTLDQAGKAYQEQTL
jgi:hypothetical protein